MNPKILVFGSINADLVFPVESLPTKGETVLGANYFFHPGGKGANQAVAAATAGGNVAFIGCVGKDGYSEELIASLKRANVDTSHIKRGDTPTGCAAIGVDSSGENQIIVASGANLEVLASQVPDHLVNSSTIVVLQMEVRPSENWSLIRRAKGLGATITLNLAPASQVPIDVLSKIDFLVTNEHEINFLSKELGIQYTNPIEAAQKVSQLTKNTCILTLGARGAFAFNKSETLKIPALELDPVDTTAAGDCFVGWLAARLSEGDNLDQSMRWASVAAGKACLVSGAQTSLPSFDTVKRIFLELHPL